MSLEKFFNPDSVAVIGAAREKEKVGHTILANIVNFGYKGKVYPINPKADSILGLECYKSLLDVPTDVDLAVIVIPRNTQNGRLPDMQTCFAQSRPIL